VQDAYAAGRDEVDELRDDLHPALPWHVLEHDVGVHEVELAVGGDSVERRDELNMREPPLVTVPPRLRQHCVGHIHADGFVAEPRQGNKDPADAAAEVEPVRGPIVRVDSLVDDSQEAGHVLLA
jgi:hypothetical protein